MDFNNTEKAFIAKSDRDLKWSSRMFTVMGMPLIQKVGQASVNFALKIHLPIEGLIKKTLFNQFVGGETIKGCSKNVDVLSTHNVKSILDYSVEGKEDEADIEAALEETLRAVKNAAKNPSIPFAVFKPTAMVKSEILEKNDAGIELSNEEKQQLAKFKERIDKLCKTAYEGDVPILVDAEDSWYQNTIDDTVDEMMLKYNKQKPIVFNTWQMYRHDRLEHLKNTYKKAVEQGYYVGAKFVRGAYMEKERKRALKYGYNSPIHPDKASTDKAYNDALRFSLEHIDRISVFCGTHNTDSDELLMSLMKENNLKNNDNRIWFAQLYGMSDNISFNLADQGYNVAKYVPYGPVRDVLPYLIRRVEENTAVKGQTNRELLLIKQEMKRRKNAKVNFLKQEMEKKRNQKPVS